jgi:hypothetical protein
MNVTCGCHFLALPFVVMLISKFGCPTRELDTIFTTFFVGRHSFLSAIIWSK